MVSSSACRTKDQAVNILTKPLGALTFCRDLRDLMGSSPVADAMYKEAQSRYSERHRQLPGAPDTVSKAPLDTNTSELFAALALVQSSEDFMDEVELAAYYTDREEECEQQHGGGRRGHRAGAPTHGCACTECHEEA
jgi:hypothetical protein